jgi:hypothetical protein
MLRRIIQRQESGYYLVLSELSLVIQYYCIFVRYLLAERVLLHLYPT